MSWGELYALMAVETGWTWEYIDEEMTLVRLDGFMSLWKSAPPLRSALAALLGIGSAKSGSRSSEPAKRPDLGAYLEGFAAAGIQVERTKVHG